MKYLYKNSEQAKSIMKHQSWLAKIKKVQKQVENLPLQLAVASVSFSDCTTRARDVQVQKVKSNKREFCRFVFCPVFVCWKHLKILRFLNN